MWLVLHVLSAAAAATTPEVELCRAAAAGDLERTKAWIRRGAQVEASGWVYVGPPRKGLPHDAVDVRETPTPVRRLEELLDAVRAGAQLGHETAEHDVLIHALSCAVSAPVPSRQVVQALVAAGASVDGLAPGGTISVYLASHPVDADTIGTCRWLRDQGASLVGVAKWLVVDDRADAPPAVLGLLDALIADGAEPPVCAAAGHGDVAVLAHLVGDPDAWVCRGFTHMGARADPRTLLDLAAEAGRLRATAWLLEHGADPDRVIPPEYHRGHPSRTAPALAYALDGQHDDVVLELVAHGADAFALDSEGGPAIRAAERLGAAPPVAALLDAARDRGQAMSWALGRAYGDEQFYSGVPEGWISGVEAAVRAWLDPTLLGLIADPARRTELVKLTPAFWDDALASVPMAGLVGVLMNEPGSRQPELRLGGNACLPQVGDPRARVRRLLGRPFDSGADFDSFVPPQTARRTLFGRAPGAAPAIRVEYLGGRVARVQVSRVADVRAAGCDAPALRYLEVPAWQRAWEYGASPTESSLYGMPDARLGSLVDVLDGRLAWSTPSSP